MYVYSSYAWSHDTHSENNLAFFHSQKNTCSGKAFHMTLETLQMLLVASWKQLKRKSVCSSTYYVLVILEQFKQKLTCGDHTVTV